MVVYIPKSANSIRAIHQFIHFAEAASRWPALGSAIDAQGLAGDEVSQWSRENLDDSRDFVDESDPIQSPFRNKSLFGDGTSPEESTSPCVTGGNRIGSNIVGAKLQGKTTSIFNNSGFGGGVNAARFIPLEGRNGTDGHDPTPAPFHHASGDMLTGEDCADQIPVENRTDINFLDHHGVVGVRFASSGRYVATRIVNQNGNRAQSCGDFLHDSLDFGILGEITQNADRANAVRLADFFGGIGQRCTFSEFGRTMFAHAVDSDSATHSGQPFSKRPP
jgi:hypothetical protein